MGSARTDHTARRKLRRRLELEGHPAPYIAEQIAELRDRQGREHVAPQPPGTPRSKLNRRRALARRDGSTCHWCGVVLDVEVERPVPSPPRATLDHVDPLSAGGPDTLENLVLSCEPCNQERGGVHGEGAHPPLVGKPSRPRRVAS